MDDVNKKTTYKPVNIATADWKDYRQAANKVSDELGMKVSLPAVIRMAMTQFIADKNGRTKKRQVEMAIESQAINEGITKEGE